MATETKKKTQKRPGVKGAFVSKIVGTTLRDCAKSLGESESFLLAVGGLVFAGLTTEQQMGLIGQYKVAHINGVKADIEAEKAKN